MERHESTCWTVIRNAADGDRDARGLFARRYEPVVRAYLKARWRGSERLENVDDAAQEVFIQCFRTGGVLDRADRSRPGGFRAFLYGVIRVVALRIEAAPARAKDRPPAADFDLGQVPDDETRISVAFDRAWARALLKEAAERQATVAQQAGAAAMRRVELLRLRFHDGLPVRDIARRWGCDADAVHREYARARQEFKSASATSSHFTIPKVVLARSNANVRAFWPSSSDLLKKVRRKTVRRADLSWHARMIKRSCGVVPRLTKVKEPIMFGFHTKSVVTVGSSSRRVRSRARSAWRCSRHATSPVYSPRRFRRFRWSDTTRLNRSCRRSRKQALGRFITIRPTRSCRRSRK